MWLDFEDVKEGDTYYSYGIGARTYGSIWPDRRPQPEMWQIKKSAQPVTAKLISAESGLVEVTNRYLFTNLNELKTEWVLQGDGEIIEKGEISLNLEPQKKAVITVPFHKPAIKEGVEYCLLMSFRQKSSTLWAGPGFEIAWDQMDLPWIRTCTEFNKYCFSTSYCGG